MDAVGNGFQQVFEEFPSRPPVSLVDQLGDPEPARTVDADEQVQPFDKLRANGDKCVNLFNSCYSVLALAHTATGALIAGCGS